MIQRNEKLSRGLRGDKDVPVVDENDVSDKTSTANNDDDAKTDALVTQKEKEDSKRKNEEPLKALDQQVIEWNQKLVSENNNLHQVCQSEAAKISTCSYPLFWGWCFSSFAILYCRKLFFKFEI
jgi:hypothetical protein